MRDVKSWPPLTYQHEHCGNSWVDGWPVSNCPDCKKPVEARGLFKGAK